MQLFFVLSILLASGVTWARDSLRVLTYNVYAKPDLGQKRMTKERMALICEELRNGPWDVVMLQEVWTKGNRRLFANCGFPHVMDLKKTGSTKKEGHLGSGLMILSKFPLLEMQRKVLSKPKGLSAIFKHGEMLVNKSVYLAKIQLTEGQGVWVATTHFVANYCKSTDFDSCPSYEEQRLKQLNEAATFLQETTQGEPLVFGGDLNMGPHPLSADRGWALFPELFPGFKQADYSDNDCTSCASNSFKESDNGKIDHLFASAALRISEGKIVLAEERELPSGISSHLSDHYGWESVVELNP